MSWGCQKKSPQDIQRGSKMDSTLDGGWGRGGKVLKEHVGLGILWPFLEIRSAADGKSISQSMACAGQGDDVHKEQKAIGPLELAKFVALPERPYLYQVKWESNYGDRRKVKKETHVYWAPIIPWMFHTLPMVNQQPFSSWFYRMAIWTAFS